MELQEIIDFYNIKPRGVGSIKKIMNQRGITFNDLQLNYETKDYAIKGIYDIKNNKPLFINNCFVEYTCRVSGELCSVPYYYWIKRDNDKKLLSASVSRSQNLSNLNKTKIRDKVIEYWESDKGKKQKEKQRVERIFYNKNIQPEIIKSFSMEKKKEVASKKRDTFYNKSVEEQNKINKKRNIYLNKTEVEKDEIRKKISETLLQQSEERSEYMKKLWNDLPYDEKINRIENLKHGYIKKQYPGLNLFYQGSYEKKFIETCLSNGVIPKRGPNIEYYDPEEDIVKIYMVDYEINGFLVEVKSLWWWEQNLRINLLKKEAAETYASENGYNSFIIYILDKLNEGFDIEDIKN